MSLKTLKDISTKMPSDNVILESHLRKEAIRWVKEFDRFKEIKERSKEYIAGWILSTKDSKHSEEDKELVNTMLQEWIKHFFNIKEEDIK